MRIDLRTIISISVFLVTISSVITWSYLPFKSTTLWWGIYAVLIFLIIKSKLYVYNKKNENNLLIFKIFIFWNIICIVRGGFVASDYWEWKSLTSTTMIMLVPFFIYTATNTFMLQKVINAWFKYALPAFLLLIPLIYPGAMGRYLIPISFIAMFFPILPKKWKIISSILFVFVFIVGASSRSNMIKFAIPLSLSFLYYINRNIANIIIKIVTQVFIITPIILFTLGVTQVFNVFKMDDYIEGDYSVSTESEGHGDLKTDTRTGLYEEVLMSAVKYDYVLFGRTPAKGNESKLFGEKIAKRINKARGINNSKNTDRYRNEACILNVFTWTGLIGVVLYFLVFVKAAHLSMYKSNNLFVKIIGGYVSFRWLYAWVEDFREFDLSTFFVWICLGICFSVSFRKLTDTEMYYWIQGLFNKKDRIIYIKSQLRKKTIHNKIIQ